MSITCVTQTLRNFYISMLRVCAPSRPIRPFLDKFRFWKKKRYWTIAQESFQKKQVLFITCAKKLLSISYLQFLVASYFFCTFFLLSSNIFYHDFKLIIYERKILLQLNFYSFILQNLGYSHRIFLKDMNKEKVIDSKNHNRNVT